MTQVLQLSLEEVCVSGSAVDNKATQQKAERTFERARPDTKMNPTGTVEDRKVANSDRALDYKLVVRVQKGDIAAFDLLVMKYQGRVSSIISRYVSDHHEVADVAQETFIKAFRAIAKFRSDSAFYTWLYRIAVNCAKNYLASRGRKTPSVDIDIVDAEITHTNQGLEDLSNPADQLNRDQLEEVVYQTLRALPEDLRMALTLREFEGLSYDEISNVMDCPVGTVRSRIFRAREAIDSAMQQAQGGL